MKKVAFILAGLLVIMFAGCGEGSSASSSVGTGDTSNDTGSELVIDNGNVSDTTVTNEFGLNPTLGTPPPLPAG